MYLVQYKIKAGNKIAVRVIKCYKIHILSVLKELIFKQQYKIKGDERKIIDPMTSLLFSGQRRVIKNVWAHV